MLLPDVLPLPLSVCPPQRLKWNRTKDLANGTGHGLRADAYNRARDGLQNGTYFLGSSVELQFRRNWPFQVSLTWLHQGKSYLYIRHEDIPRGWILYSNTFKGYRWPWKKYGVNNCFLIDSPSALTSDAPVTWCARRRAIFSVINTGWRSEALGSIKHRKTSENIGTWHNEPRYAAHDGCPWFRSFSSSVGGMMALAERNQHLMYNELH